MSDNNSENQHLDQISDLSDFNSMENSDFSESDFSGFSSEDDFDFEPEIEPERPKTRSPSPDLPVRSLTLAEKAFIGESSPGAIARIMKDRKEIHRKELYNKYFEIDFADDNVHIWNLLMRFPEQEKTQKDLNQYAIDSRGKHPNAIKMEITFPSDYPMAPPFVRVVSPKLNQRTGRVTIGGSICTQLLTNSGWVPTYSIGQALIQIQSEIIDGNPVFQPYNHYYPNEYSKQEAEEAFRRVAREKGWQ